MKLVLILLVVAAVKAPVPSPELQQDSRKTAADLYGDRFVKAKTAADKVALAKELLEAGLKVEDGLTDQYVLLDLARDVAAGAGETATAVEAAEALAARFEVGALKLKAKTLLAVAQHASSTAQRKALAEAAGPVVDELAAAEDFAAAIELCQEARAAAQSARHSPLVKELAARTEAVKRQQAACEEYQTALATLEKSPADPAANLAAGRYLCFSKGDWARGVSLLALGSDRELQAAAQQELACKTADQQVALADAWWRLAAQRDESERTALMLHAGAWYRRAEPDLTGLARVKVEKQLAAIEKLGQEIPEPAGGPPAAVAPFDAKTAKQHQARWAKYLKLPVEMTNSIGMKLVLIPPGEFKMGSTKEEVARLTEQISREEPGQWEAWEFNVLRSESPRHSVKISKPFYLGIGEVTQAEYQKVTGENPSHFKGGAFRPVEMLTWEEAADFCRKLSELPKEKTAGAYRLPTEAEWEYACRAGTATRFSFGDQDAALDQHAWRRANSRAQTQPIGQLKPNAWGLFDMQGNVWEWCLDWYSPSAYPERAETDPTGPTTSDSQTRIVRGGSWYRETPVRFRCAWRYVGGFNKRYSDGGFRVLRAVADPLQPNPKP